MVYTNLKNPFSRSKIQNKIKNCDETIKLISEVHKKWYLLDLELVRLKAKNTLLKTSVLGEPEW